MFRSRITTYYLHHPICPHCGAGVASNTQTCPFCAIPLLVDRYRLVRVIAHTAAGSLFDAIDLRSGRRCAIKRMIPRPGPNPYAMIEDELASLEQLRGLPCVPRHSRKFWVDDECYLAFSAITGAPLTELVGRPWTVAQVMAFLDTGLTMLMRMHQRDMMLRNLTPANLIYTHDNRLLLIDYGAFVPSLAETFAAPEMSTPELVSVRTDLYHLGASTYSLLNGGHPPSPRHRQGAMTVADLPDVLRKILGDMLSRDERRRPRKAEDVLRRLRGSLGTRVKIVAALLLMAVIMGASLALLSSGIPVRIGAL